MKWNTQPKLVAIAAAVTLAVQLAISQAAALPAESKPVEKAGLSVIIQPNVKSTFAIDEPIILKVSFRNTTSAAFRLPQNVVPMNWQLIATDLDSGKTFTGGGFLPGFNGRPSVPGETIAAGETFAAPAVFSLFHFFEGAMDDDSLKHRVFKEQMAALKANKGQYTDLRHPLPPGRYKVGVDIRYPYKPAAGDGDVPIWKENSLLTDTVEIVVSERDTTSGHLLVTRYYLDRALAALRKENHGGERAIAAAEQAIAEVDAAMNYVKANPQIDALPAKLVTETSQLLPDELSFNIPQAMREKPNSWEALLSLHSAQMTFVLVAEVPGGKPAGWVAPLLIIGPLDGHRDTILKRITETAREAGASFPQ